MVKKVEHDGREMWAYGEAGDRWPVTDRDVWACGPHRFVCGDIHNGAFDILAERFSIDLIYTDPPWSLSNEKAFRTKAGLDNSDAAFENLITRIARTAASVSHVFIETSNYSESRVAAILESVSGKSPESWPITYYGDNSCRLLYVGDGSPPEMSGLDDEETPSKAIGSLLTEDAFVADPCTGNGGLTARAAESDGHRFVGVELHPRRLACVLSWFAEQGYKPVRISKDYTTW